MWPIPPIEHEIVSISFSPDALVCSWIQKAKNGTAPLVLRAYKRYQLTNLELEKLILFNPTDIKKYITSFLQEHNIRNAFITFCFDGPGVTEKYVAMPTSTPHRTDFGIPQSSTILWEYRYVYGDDHGRYIFYVYIVPRSLLLQYQLLAIAVQCNVITITTKTMALLDAYKNIFGVAFRRSQLAVDMMHSGNNIDDLISVDAVRRMVSVPVTINVMDESLSIAAACGLFCGEKND
jgi:hypothetical protein